MQSTSIFLVLQDLYDVREMIGHGTSGEVRRAINRTTGKQVAVKVRSHLRCYTRTRYGYLWLFALSTKNRAEFCRSDSPLLRISL